jgi:hypothetical protein
MRSVKSHGEEEEGRSDGTPMNLRYAAALDSKFVTLERVLGDQRSVAPHMIRALRASTVYAWDYRIAAVVDASADELSKETSFTLDQLPEERTPCWWWLEPKPRPPTPHHARWIGILFYPERDNLVFGMFRGRHVLDGFFGAWRLPWNEPYRQLSSWDFFTDTPDSDYWNEKRTLDAYDVTSFVRAGLAWINQRILSTAAQTPERHARRRAEKLDPSTPVSDIRVIQLRRRTASHQPPALGDEQALVQWMCQWMVSGHWRQQYYPKSAAHRPIWITPYVKGPADKPLKVPSQRLYAVVR